MTLKYNKQFQTLIKTMVNNKETPEKQMELLSESIGLISTLADDASYTAAFTTILNIAETDAQKEEAAQLEKRANMKGHLAGVLADATTGMQNINWLCKTHGLEPMFDKIEDRNKVMEHVIGFIFEQLTQAAEIIKQPEFDGIEPFGTWRKIHE